MSIYGPHIHIARKHTTHTHTLTLFHLALVNNPLIFTPTVSINMQHHTTLLFRIDWPLEEGWGCSCHTISIYTRPHTQRYETCLVPLYMFKTLTTWYMMIGGVYWIAWFILQFCMLWLWMWTNMRSRNQAITNIHMNTYSYLSRAHRSAWRWCRYHVHAAHARNG